ncbi:MAG: hypothetical protein HGB17_05550, partial [Syntrophobacteraceae bacterium]|nr:hypothetical protein [Syntrophobacteraceae bacterium]
MPVTPALSPEAKAAAFADKVFVDGLTQGIENWANKYSALIGYHSTRNLKGLTPRQRALAREDMQFLTWDHPLVIRNERNCSSPAARSGQAA